MLLHSLKDCDLFFLFFARLCNKCAFLSSPGKGTKERSGEDSEGAGQDITYSPTEAGSPTGAYLLSDNTLQKAHFFFSRKRLPGL